MTPLVRMRYLTPNDRWLATVRPFVRNQLPRPTPLLEFGWLASHQPLD